MGSPWRDEPLTQTEIEDLRQQLIKRQKELEDLSTSSQSIRSAVQLDQSRMGRLSRMDALQVQAMEEAIEGKRKEEQIRISYALERIEEDEIGECFKCGEGIPLPRLRFDPSLTTCVVCTD